MSESIPYFDLSSGPTGTVVAAITKEQAILVEIFSGEVVNRINLLEDTGTRISLDANLNRFILGSWRKGIRCLELQSGKQLWHVTNPGFTYVEIIDFRREIYVTGQKGDINTTLILDLETGMQTQSVHVCSDFLARNNFMLGHNGIDDHLLIYDKDWNLLGTPQWKSFALWDFASSDDDILIVSGPSGYAGSFIAGLDTPIGEVKEDEYFSRIELVCWNKAKQCFMAIASEFEGTRDRVLMKFDHTFQFFDVIRRFPISNREVICEGHYLVTESGLILDLDTEAEVGAIDWAAVLG